MTGGTVTGATVTTGTAGATVMVGSGREVAVGAAGSVTGGFGDGGK